MIIIDSDDDSEGRAKPSESADMECHLMEEAAESLHILRRARKRRRREMQAIRLNGLLDITDVSP